MPVITPPGDNQPFVLAESVVQRLPLNQKSKPIGMLLKKPSSALPADKAGDVPPVKVVNVPLDAANT